MDEEYVSMIIPHRHFVRSLCPKYSSTKYPRDSFRLPSTIHNTTTTTLHNSHQFINSSNHHIISQNSRWLSRIPVGVCHAGGRECYLFRLSTGTKTTPRVRKHNPTQPTTRNRTRLQRETHNTGTTIIKVGHGCREYCEHIRG